MNINPIPAFTLVELLVVIAILAAMRLPLKTLIQFEPVTLRQWCKPNHARRDRPCRKFVSL